VSLRQRVEGGGDESTKLSAELQSRRESDILVLMSLREVEVNAIDHEALLFGGKFVVAIMLLMMAAHFGTSALAMRWFASEVIDARAQQHLSFERESLTDESRHPLALSAHAAGVAAQRAHEIPASGVYAQYDRVIHVDLATKHVKLVRDGVPSATLPLASVPAFGSQRYASAGVYPVVERITDFYSPIAGVHLPYAVRFSEHLVVHGLPYRPGGDAVDPLYVGAGFRLTSDDAQRVFQFVDDDTVVLIDGAQDTTLAANAIELRSNPLPQINARAFALADLETGELLLERNATTPRAIASITKLMTALVTAEQIKSTREVPIRGRSEQYAAYDLLYPLLLRSDNGIANDLAAFQGTEWFLEQMNTKAKLIGMESTSFADPSGLSAHNRSTARDLVRLSRYLYLEHEAVLAVSKRSRATIVNTRGRAWNMTNQNRFAGDPYFVGGKLGFTDEAGRTGLSIASVPVGNEVRTVAIVVLGSSDWKRDSDLLIDWLKRSGTPQRLTRE
jgi:hypothetical protein